MEKLGTDYGGWYIPLDITLNENSIVYSGGVGEDISFDILLSEKYNPNIYLIDPTKRSNIHFNETLQYFNNKLLFTGNIQKDYYDKIGNSKPNLNKFFYLNTGLWDKKETLRFYKQENQSYVSQSLIPGMFGNEYDIINVTTIKDLMVENNHTHIDLLKLDIEGAEINVLNKMFNDNIFPSYLCIEFDLKLKNKDYNNETNKLIYKIINDYNYTILINDNWNITFLRQ